MSEEKKKDLDATVNMLKGLDRQDLLLVQASAQVLKARQDMDEQGESSVKQ